MFVCGECGELNPHPGACPVDGGRLAPVDHTLGTEVSRYRLAKKVGQGGMGAVYLGIRPSIGSRVAIKVLSDDCASDLDMIERFFAEARAVNLIRHENIVDVLDLGWLPDGRPFIVMELVDGQTLGHIVRRSRAPLGGIASVAIEILSALDAAHAIGIVHRDLKPDNVLITAKGHAKVLDFGIAKLARPLSHARTQAGALLGTPAYMAPEQLADAATVDGRADIYAAGVLLFEAVTSRLPFTGSTYELMRAHAEDPPPSVRSLRPDVPPTFEQVIFAALDKDPARRFQRAAHMAAALREATRELAPEQWQMIAHVADSGHAPHRAPLAAGTPIAGAAPETTIAGAARPVATPSVLAPSYAASSGAAPSVVAPSVVVPSYTPSSGAAPSAVAPSYVASSVVAPSFATPSVVAPSVVTRSPSATPASAAGHSPSGAPPHSSPPGATQATYSPSSGANLSSSGVHSPSPGAAHTPWPGAAHSSSSGAAHVPGAAHSPSPNTFPPSSPVATQTMPASETDYSGRYSVPNSQSLGGPQATQSTTYSPSSGVAHSPSSGAARSPTPGATQATYSPSGAASPSSGATQATSPSSGAAHSQSPGVTQATYAPSSGAAHSQPPGVTQATYSPSSGVAHSPGVTQSTFSPLSSGAHGSASGSAFDTPLPGSSGSPIPGGGAAMLPAFAPPSSKTAFAPTPVPTPRPMHGPTPVYAPTPAPTSAPAPVPATTTRSRLPLAIAGIAVVIAGAIVIGAIARSRSAGDRTADNARSDDARGDNERGRKARNDNAGGENERGRKARNDNAGGDNERGRKARNDNARSDKAGTGKGGTGKAEDAGVERPIGSRLVTPAADLVAALALSTDEAKKLAGDATLADLQLHPVARDGKVNLALAKPKAPATRYVFVSESLRKAGKDCAIIITHTMNAIATSTSAHCAQPPIRPPRCSLAAIVKKSSAGRSGLSEGPVTARYRMVDDEPTWTLEWTIEIPMQTEPEPMEVPLPDNC